ncbi:MAG: hypothetical protein ACKOXO_05110 [Cyanobium sp.]
METSSTSELSASSSRSEYLSTLPPWRRLLAILNWRPAYEYELRAIERKRRLQQLESDRIREKLESERQRIEYERRLRESDRRLRESEKRLRQIESEIAQLQESNARIARFEQELFSSSNQTPSTGDSSPP